MNTRNHPFGVGRRCALVLLFAAPSLAAPTRYADLSETLDANDLERWSAAQASLARGFDDVCGDTFCEGDFNNLTSVRLSCTSTVAAKKMKACTWILGGSLAEVDAATGAITSDARVFTCPVPVRGSATTFLRSLEAAQDDVIHAALPGTSTSFYDALVDCFAGMVGRSPPSATRPFVDLGATLQSDEASWSAWTKATHALVDVFEDICGDTFCEGDYPDISPLGFTCAVDSRTALVSTCAWSFALADTSADALGAVDARTSTATCTFPVDAPVADFVAALSVADALHATLPGKTPRIYDALGDCL